MSKTYRLRHLKRFKRAKVYDGSCHNHTKDSVALAGDLLHSFYDFDCAIHNTPAFEFQGYIVWWDASKQAIKKTYDKTNCASIEIKSHLGCIRRAFPSYQSTEFDGTNALYALFSGIVLHLEARSVLSTSRVSIGDLRQYPEIAYTATYSSRKKRGNSGLKSIENRAYRRTCKQVHKYVNYRIEYLDTLVAASNNAIHSVEKFKRRSIKDSMNDY